MSEHRVVVITGASAGVGRAAVRAFAEDGADVALLARGRDGLEAAAREVEALGRRALVLPTDVSVPEAVEAAAEAVERDLGPIDVWVNDAMVTVMSPVKEMTAEDYRRVTEVSYLGAINGTLAALRRMLPRDHGVIVQVGSAVAYRSIPLQSAYSGAKYALRGFTNALRTELIHDGSKVHVTMVHLPAVNTPQFTWSKSRMDRAPQPVPPIYEPEIPARAIVFASKAHRREVWVGTSSVKVILGNKLLPKLGDLYLARTGFRAQLTDEPADPDRPNNLWEPLPGDHGAHGPFDARARRHSLQQWASRHRGALLLGSLGALGAGGAAWAIRR